MEKDFLIGKKFDNLTVSGYRELKIGDKFGHWTVIGGYIRPSQHREYLCKCDCKDKTERYVDEQNLKRGKSISCGCVTKEVAKKHFTKHGKTKTRLYNVWASMKERCYNKNNGSYKNYGGRGIKICDEWLSSFETFQNWALSTGYDENAKYGEVTIDRINVDGNYEPLNCRWVSIKEQNNNRRSNVKIEYNNEIHNIKEWSELLGIDRMTISSRLKKGLPLDKVFYQGNLRRKNERIS